MGADALGIRPFPGESMKTIRTLQVVHFFPGAVLQLTPDQVEIRSHNLRDLKDGTFEVIHPIEFRAGEEIGYSGDITPAMARVVDTLDLTDGLPLEDTDRESLLAIAQGLGLKPNPNTGKAKLIEAIKAEQDRLLAEQNAAEAKAARIAELEAKGDAISDEEKAELNSLKSVNP